MNIPLGIVVSATATGAMGQLGALERQLQRLGGVPASIAAGGMARFEEVGVQAAARVEQGLAAAENAWWKLGSALGLPLSLAGVFGAVSGIRSLRGAVIDANSAMETTQARMGSMLRDWNDSKESARLKAAGVTGFVENYAGTTSFDTQGVTEAAVSATMYTKDPRAVEEAVKLSAKLAAYKGTTDIAWAGQAFQSAMNGDTSSLRMSFGINVNEDQLTQTAMTLGYGNSMRGRFEALKFLIEQRAGKDDQIVKDLAKTGVGASNILQDSFAVPIRHLTEPAYKEGVAALVRFNEAMSKFQDSGQFKSFMTSGQAFFAQIGGGIGRGVDVLANNLERIPSVLQRYGPALLTLAKFAAVVLALSTASLALHGALLLARSSAAVFLRFLTPLSVLVANPLLVAGLLALSAAMWPTARSLEIGGKSLDAWMTQAERWSAKKDWKATFAGPLEALRGLLSGDWLSGDVDLGKRLEDALGSGGLLTRLGNVVRPAARGLRDAVLETFPEIGTALGAAERGWTTYSGLVARGWEVIGSTVTRAEPVLRRGAETLRSLVPEGQREGLANLAGVALALGGVAGLLTKLGLSAPLLLLARGALLGVLGAVAALGSAVGLPLLVAGVTALSLALYPLVRDLKVGGTTLDGWVARLGRVSGAVDWEGLLSKPLVFLRRAVDWLTGKALTADLDIVAWWKNVLAPDSLISRIGDVLKPVWVGLLRALDNAFPELDGWFESHFGEIGTDLRNVFTTVVNTVGPVLSGILSTFQDLAVTLRPVLSGLTQFILAFAGVAWDLVRGAFQWLARATGTRENQDSLRELGRVLGGIAVSVAATVAALKAIPAATAAVNAAASVGRGVGAAATWAAANPALASGLGVLGLTVAAVTITAASVKMFNQNREENLDKSKLWWLVSPTRDKSEGLGMRQTFEALEQRYAFKNNPEALRASLSLLGALGTVVQRPALASRYIDQAGYRGQDLTRAKEAAGAGEGVGNSIMQQLAGLAGQTGLPEQVGRALGVISAARTKLRALDAEFAMTGKLDEREVSRLSSVFFRNVAALANAGYLKDILPASISDGLRVLGVQTGLGARPQDISLDSFQFDPPSGDVSDGAGGGSSPQAVPMLPPLPPTSRREVPILPDVNVTIHATPAQGVSADEIARRVRAEVQALLGGALNGGF